MNGKQGAKGQRVQRFQMREQWDPSDVYVAVAISIGSLIAGVMLIIEKIAAISGGG